MAIKSFMQDKGKSKQPASGASKKAADSAMKLVKEKGSNPGGGGSRPFSPAAATSAARTNPGGFSPATSASPFPAPFGAGGAGGGVGTNQQWGEYAGSRGGFQNPGGVDQITGAGFSPTDMGAGMGSYGGGGVAGGGMMPMDPTMAGLGYSPQGASTLYESPEVLAADVLASLGIDNPAMAQVIADIFGPALYNQFISTGGMGDQSDPATMGRIYDVMQQFVTPGGQVFDANALMQSILGLTAEGSPAGAAFAMGTPQEQVGQVGSAMQSARYGLNPLAQRAYRNAMDWYGTKYLTDSLKNPATASPYTEYLAGTPLAGWTR